jgi:hypothetical protein
MSLDDEIDAVVCEVLACGTRPVGKAAKIAYTSERSLVVGFGLRG